MSRAADRHSKGRRRVAAVAVLVLALVLRLPWTLPITGDPSRSFAAAFGEHALCLAAAGDQASGSGGEAPAGPADHDAAKCCQSHAAGQIVLPAIGTMTVVVFAAPADRFFAADPAPAPRSIGRAWARAPPIPAG